jgi:hypothetical protein
MWHPAQTSLKNLLYQLFPCIINDYVIHHDFAIHLAANYDIRLNFYKAILNIKCREDVCFDFGNLNFII